MLINRIPMEILPAGATTQPSTDNKKGLSEVAAFLLYHYDEIPSINIPKGTKKLRGYTFNDCWPNVPLTVTIPEGVIEVRNKAFCNCSLKLVEFPSTITTLPSDCFSDTSPEKIIFHSPKDSIAGYPWGADNEPVIEWRG